MTTALAELSKSELIDKVERVQALAKRVRDKHSKEEILWRAVNTVVSGTGGAAAAGMQYAAHKFFRPEVAGKVTFGLLILQDLGSLAFEGTAARVYDAFAHGQNGFFAGDALKAKLGHAAPAPHK